MSIKVVLNPVELRVVGDWEGSVSTMYNPEDEMIMVKTVDEGDRWYSFIWVIHAPEIKTVLFVSMYQCAFICRPNWEKTTSTMDNSAEEVIRGIMRLPDDYTVTDSRELFKQRREEYLNDLRQSPHDTMPYDDLALNYHVIPLAEWQTLDVDELCQLNGDEFIDFPKGKSRIEEGADVNQSVKYWESLFYMVEREPTLKEQRTLCDTTFVQVSLEC